MVFLEDIYDIINNAIELAFFNEKYQLDFYAYLKSQNFKRETITEFLGSNLCKALQDQIQEIDMYLDGGDSAALLKEAYSWMGKSRARKVKDYLNTIVEDAKKYEQSKRRGRKPGSKNKKKGTATTNK
jgi:hypothetical protein